MSDISSCTVAPLLPSRKKREERSVRRVDEVSATGSIIDKVVDRARITAAAMLGTF